MPNHPKDVPATVESLDAVLDRVLSNIGDAADATDPNSREAQHTSNHPTLVFTASDRIDAIAHAMSASNVEGALVQYRAMLRENPLLPDLAQIAGLSQRAWLEKVGSDGLWEGPGSFGDMRWLYSKSVTAANFGFDTMENPADAAMYRFVSRIFSQTSDNSVAISGYPMSVVLLQRIYVLTRRFGTHQYEWCPGSNAVTYELVGVNPRALDALRMTMANMHVQRAGMGRTDALMTLLLSGPKDTNIVLGDVRLLGAGITSSVGANGHERQALQINYQRSGSPMRTIELEPEIGSEIVLAAAWDLADWIYEEAEDSARATLLAYGYETALVDVAVAGMEALTAIQDDGDLIARAKDLADADDPGAYLEDIAGRAHRNE